MTTTEPHPSASRFLRGLMTPMTHEHDDRALQVRGKLPAGLRGMFVRNGPNPQFAPLGAYHPFDGDGMLHAVYLEDGEARYRNRWVESKGLQVERRLGQAAYGGLAEFRIPEADVVSEGGILKNTGNTHTVRHAGKILALMEAGRPTAISPELDTLGEEDFGGALVGPVTAHPKIDPVTGELIFFSYNPFPPHLRYHVADAAGVLIHSIEIDLPDPVMIHDMAFTEHYSIFIDSPAIFDVPAMMAGGKAMRWEADRATRIGVIPRMGSAEEIRWFEMDPCYVVHFFNAWEATDGTLEIRAPRFDHMPGAFDFDDPQGQSDPLPWRWSIDLAAGTVSDEQTDERDGEFPRINDDYAGRSTRYLYYSRPRTWEFEFEFHNVTKIDIESGHVTDYHYADSDVSGEHVFAPNPDGTSEDDGWLLSMVVNRTDESSRLAVLDARDVAAGPVAEVIIPRRVPLGFHANWFPTQFTEER